MKKYLKLLSLARESVAFELEGKEIRVKEAVKEKYSEKKACFVTLTINGELRGCIGSLEARQELWKDVVENARSAAFSDSRFETLSLGELKKIKIEVSILSIPEEIAFKDSEELKKKIKGKGVILQSGFYSATYLPQVWEDIPVFEDFISSLCQKAGINPHIWREKHKSIRIWIYSVEKVSE